MKSLFQRTKMLDEAKQGIIKKDEVVTEPLKPNGHNVIVEILIFIVVLLVLYVALLCPDNFFIISLNSCHGNNTASLPSNFAYISV